MVWLQRKLEIVAQNAVLVWHPPKIAVDKYDRIIILSMWARLMPVLTSYTIKQFEMIVFKSDVIDEIDDQYQEYNIAILLKYFTCFVSKYSLW